MKNLATIGLIVAGGFVLSGCGLTGKTEMIKIIQAEKAESIPKWYVKLPEDEDELIYGAGTGLSSDLQFSMDKAMHQAKTVLGDKINNKVSMEMKTYIADNSVTGTNTAVEETQKVSKSGYKDVDVSEYVVQDKSVTIEGIGYRTYVLLKVNPKGRKNTAPVITKETLESVQGKARESLDKL